MNNNLDDMTESERKTVLAICYACAALIVLIHITVIILARERGLSSVRALKDANPGTKFTNIHYPMNGNQIDIP